MLMKIYTLQELQHILQTIPEWVIVNEAIERTFLFTDFKQALGFIVQVGVLAEQSDHHPEIMNVYNKVVIRLNTHSANAITSKDIDLATKINGLR
jgi:4a-hydroxytetrahydrobiopterin dehydratase